KLRGNVVGLTRAQDIVLRALERRQAKPVPPPLPDVSVGLDWALGPEAEGEAPDAGAGPDPAGEDRGDPPQAATRPAIVVPRLEPKPPVDKELMEQMVAAARKEINDRLDRERGGTPQEWYARQREAVRQRDAAAAAAKAAAGDELAAEPGAGIERGPPDRVRGRAD